MTMLVYQRVFNDIHDIQSKPRDGDSIKAPKILQNWTILWKIIQKVGQHPSNILPTSQKKGEEKCSMEPGTLA